MGLMLKVLTSVNQNKCRADGGATNGKNWKAFYKDRARAERKAAESSGKRKSYFKQLRRKCLN